MTDLGNVKALAWDIGGTIFDWHHTIRDEVSAIAEAQGVEDGGLRDPAAHLPRFDLELQPGTARDLHLGPQAEQAAGFDGLYAPEVERVAGA